MISGSVRPPRDGLPGGNARLSWILNKFTYCGGGKISTRRRANGCCRSCQAAPVTLLISARRARSEGS